MKNLLAENMRRFKTKNLNSKTLNENFDEKTANDLINDVINFLTKRDIVVKKGGVTTWSLDSINSPASNAFNNINAERKAVIWMRDVAAAGENDYWSNDAPMWIELLISPNIIDDVKEIASPSTTSGLLSFIGDTNMDISDTISDKSGWADVRIYGKTGIGWNPDASKNPNAKPSARAFGGYSDPTSYIPSETYGKDNDN